MSMKNLLNRLKKLDEYNKIVDMLINLDDETFKDIDIDRRIKLANKINKTFVVKDINKI